jgi:hypothetical protein
MSNEIKLKVDAIIDSNTLCNLGKTVNQVIIDKVRQTQIDCNNEFIDNGEIEEIARIGFDVSFVCNQVMYHFKIL